MAAEDQRPRASAGSVPIMTEEAQRTPAAVQPTGGALEEALATPISPTRQAIRRFARNKLAVVSLAVLIILIVATVTAQWLPLVDGRTSRLLHAASGAG